MGVQKADCFLMPQQGEGKMGDQSLPPRPVRRNSRLAIDESSPSRAGGRGRIRRHA